MRDALDGLSARDLERMRGLIDRRLRECAIDGNDGAIAVRCRTKDKWDAVFTIMLCPSCVERHRLPALRSDSGPDD